MAQGFIHDPLGVLNDIKVLTSAFWHSALRVPRIAKTRKGVPDGS
jgi:hypothetical protein